MKVPVGQDLWPRPPVPIGWNMTVTLSLAGNKLPQADAPRYPGRGALLPVSNTFIVSYMQSKGNILTQGLRHGSGKLKTGTVLEAV